MPLGFDPSLSLNNPIDREYRQFMASSLQQLGKQVSEGIKQVATNRQLKQMGDELKQVSPDSPYFPQEMVGIVTRYPLAVSDNRGVAALNLLGNSHKNWLTQQYKSSQAQRKNPLVRNFPDKTSRQYNPETKGWDVITDAPELPTKQAKQPDVTLQIHRLNSDRKSYVAELEKVEGELKAITENPSNPGLGGLAGVTAGMEKGKYSRSAQRAQQLREEIGQLDRMIDSVQSNQPQMDAEVFSTQEEMPLQGGGGPTPLTAQSIEPEALIPVQPKAIDRTTAAEFLKKAGGDRKKARELASQEGYSF